ncbi:glycoside hydrolase family 28 [Gemmatirosa kalamazoonensis]|uniref:Glycoside hydrolase family 28 n=1 Tax=Gemmatirosa kalamazoonensis TaxID=861299 RepID=W0R9X2_9BACT|nr:glycoside hydrolase family 28 protein [Gemmatirosa kalamazoonensis]AHG87909.1 glycoside hydrolase family 28 [Gemmatirosa kalamazoonensis]
MPTRREFLAASGATLVGLALPRGALLGAAPEDPAVAAILRRIVAPTFPSRAFRVTDHGAVGNGVADCRPAFAQAIDACNRAGGGRVIVPAGRWVSNGPIHLKSAVELHLEAGATIRFSADPAHYLPMVLTRWEGTECYNYSPLVYAYEATNVAITGPGTLDGNGAAGFAAWRAKQDADVNRLRQMGIDQVPVHERVFGPGHVLRPGMVQLFGCRNVLLDGFTIVDATFWSVHPLLCQNVTMRGVTVRSRNPNNDGIDPESSVDVLVERCTFDTGDDCIAVKSGRDQDGWRVGQAAANIVLRDCDMTSLKAALCIGSEMSGGVRDVHLYGCRVKSCATGAYFKTNLDRGGSIRRVRIHDVTIGEAESFINFTTAYQGYRGGKFPPDVRDVSLERVTCDHAKTGIRAVGVPDAPLRDLLLRDVTLTRADVPHEVKYVENLKLERVRVNGQLLSGLS